MALPVLSVVIPTHNRASVLPKCLRSWFDQSIPSNSYEVLIVNDGSTDNTEAVVERLMVSAPLMIRLLNQEHAGQGAARNAGVLAAGADIVLFTEDHMIATPRLLEEHLRWHRQYAPENVAVLGHITWAPEVRVTPFMWWLENGGPYLRYWQISNPLSVPARYFYTGNISLKRQFLLDNGLFDEDFKGFGYEDTELGFRLARDGMRIVYAQDALAHHYYTVSVGDALHRMRRVGESYPLFLAKIGQPMPDPPRSPSWRWRISLVKFELLSLVGRFCERRCSVPWLYGYLTDKAKLEGTRAAIRWNPGG